MTINRIAILRALQLGDLLVAVPALRAIRKAYPGAEITLIGLPWAAGFAQRFRHYIDRFVTFSGYPGLQEMETTPERTERFLAEQRAYGYDLAIQLHGSGQASNPCVLAMGAKAMAGLYEGEPPPGLTIGALYPHDQHEIWRCLRLAEALGCRAIDPRLEFPLEARDLAEAGSLLAGLPENGGTRIGMHAGARPPSRRWPAEYFADVADDLAQRYGAQIILTGGPDEIDTVQAVQECMRAKAYSVAGKTSLGSLAALIGTLDLFITNDTGPAHLAVAVGTPSITLFGPADYTRWAALNQARHPALREAVPCSPCEHWTCPIDHRCLRRLAPQRVSAQAAQLLQQGGVHASPEYTGLAHPW
jgi:ADP-heptose:LPS heptosyltransferase